MSSAGLVSKNKIFVNVILSYLIRDPLKSFKIPLVPQGNFLAFEFIADEISKIFKGCQFTDVILGFLYMLDH